jgi:mono/diheme cytochrome c family protein
MPQTVVDGSICQPSPFLYKISKSPTESSIKTETIDKSEIHIIPSLRANRIVSYLQSLHQNYQLPEIAFSDLDEEDETILSEVAASVSISETNSSSLPSWLNQQITSGKEIYSKLSAGGGMCVACHLPNGQGQTGAFPPLAGSDWVLGDKERLIKISIHGLQGEIVVNGEKYVGAMQGFGQPLSSPLDDQQIADVLTYIRNEWGNSVSAISPEEVKAVRDSEKNRELVSMWTNAELQKEDSSD